MSLGPLRSLADRARRLVRSSPSLSRRVLPWAERAHRFRARLMPRRPDRPLERVVYEYSRAVPQATFVQVGAHDGTQLDPLREAILGSGWRGIMVEPVPYVFERLAARYASNPRLILENVAISDQDGSREFHYLGQAGPEDSVWKWYDALGSFKRDVVLSHGDLVNDIERRIMSVELPCLTFSTLCRRNNVTRVDVVQIDTEGYDREVLELIDFAELGVDLVMFEHLHLHPDGRAACRVLLECEGFEMVSDGMDTIAVHERALSHPDVRRSLEEARGALLDFQQ